MCKYKIGCCANQICGLLFGAINLTICISYIIALIMLAIQCGEKCYPHYYNPHLYGIIMILSAIILYIFGFLLSYMAYKRGQNTMNGCNIWIIILIEIMLLGTLTLCIWNMYDLIFHSNTNNYPKLYGIMVVINAIWNILLCIITINILKKDATNLKTKGSFTELSPVDEDHDDDHDELRDANQVISKSHTPVKSQSENDHMWRQDSSSGPKNAYDNEMWQQSEENNLQSKTNSKNHKQINNNNAYGAGFAGGNAGNPFGNNVENISKDANDNGGKSGVSTMYEMGSSQNA
eukprot:207913_1